MYGTMSICCVHRDNKHLNLFLYVWEGGGHYLAKKLKAPGKALEIPGKHGKSWETRKDSGKSRDIFLVFNISRQYLDFKWGQLLTLPSVHWYQKR